MEDSYSTFNTMERQRLIEKPAPDRISARRVLSILASLGLLLSYVMQINLDTGIRAMNNETIEEKEIWSGRCWDGENVTDTRATGEFNWDSRTQHLVHASFFCGYLLTHLPGGWLSTRAGAKHVIGVSVFLVAVLNLATPIMARISVYLLMVVRGVEGLCQGALHPAVHALWGKWSPKWELTTWVSFTYGGAMMGGVIAWSVSDPLTNTYQNRWPWIYYISGALACLWLTVWTLLVHSTPADHPRISKKERKLIQESTGKTQLPIPWKSILTSPTVGAICVCHFCGSWMFYTMTIYVAKYVKAIYNIDVQEPGWWSSIPYLSLCLTMVLIGYVCDVVRSKGWLSTIGVRSLMTATGLLVPASLLVISTNVGCETRTVVCLLVVAITVYGCVYGGFYVNHLDIAPRFAGVIMGLSGTFGAIPALIVPAFVEYLSDVSHSMSTWRTIFLLNGCLSVFACVVFLCIGSGEEMSWARPPDDGQSKDRRRRNKRVDKWMVDSTDLADR